MMASINIVVISRSPAPPATLWYEQPTGHENGEQDQ